jgi:cytochrome c oxidase accessory protein FixG
MINVVQRRFSILGQIFWPQDTLIFAVAMLLFLTSIIIFTTAFGRLWCGWTCPQTLLMEMVFRKLEYAIEGDAPAQRALAAAPWTPAKVLKKTLKHGIFLALSFVIGNTLLSYIIGSDALWQIVQEDPAQHGQGLGFMVLFTLLFYAIFARFREQACTFICPYGRFQSTMLDENSMVVAYDHKRGERREPRHRDQGREERRGAGAGDCVDCKLCVAVCPTGIDIRNGTQMECVHCTACIDACDSIMAKTHQPPGLIRYTSLNSIERGVPFRVTARMLAYSGVLVFLVALLAFLIFTRSAVQTTLLRAPGALFQTTPEGLVQNLYTLKLVNKTSRDIPVQLRLLDLDATLSVMGGRELLVPKEQLTQTSVLIAVDPRRLRGPATRLKVGVFSQGQLLETINTVFIGPRDGSTL